MYFSALDADEHTEIPADTVKWLANIACKYFRVTTPFKSERFCTRWTLFFPIEHKFKNLCFGKFKTGSLMASKKIW